MGGSFAVVFNKAVVLIIFAAIGFLLCKIKYISADFGIGLSKLLVFVIIPLLKLKTFAQNITQYTIKNNIKCFIYGTVLLAVMFLIALPMGRAFGKNHSTLNIYRYALCIPNISYFGYPVISGMFGDGVLTNVMIMTIPLEMFIYTVGYYMLEPKKQFDLTKVVNPTVIAAVVGIIVGLTGFELPQIVVRVCDAAGDCAMPITMTAMGFLIGNVTVKQLFGSFKPYLLSVWRLIAVPAMLFGVLWLLKTDKNILVAAVAIYSMPVCFNAAIFPGALGGDSRSGTVLCFVSTVFAFVTVPLIFWAMQQLL
ncbi:MAG: AEC family transporter [Oscillospiraceae bacterium]|nr:AEC family transporter [Oscillospiraceae bacterium]